MAIATRRRSCIIAATPGFFAIEEYRPDGGDCEYTLHPVVAWRVTEWTNDSEDRPEPPIAEPVCIADVPAIDGDRPVLFAPVTGTARGTVTALDYAQWPTFEAWKADRAARIAELKAPLSPAAALGRARANDPEFIKADREARELSEAHRVHEGARDKSADRFPQSAARPHNPFITENNKTLTIKGRGARD